LAAQLLNWLVGHHLAAGAKGRCTHASSGRIVRTLASCVAFPNLDTAIILRVVNFWQNCERNAGTWASWTRLMMAGRRIAEHVSLRPPPCCLDLSEVGKEQSTDVRRACHPKVTLRQRLPPRSGCTYCPLAPTRDASSRRLQFVHLDDKPHSLQISTSVSLNAIVAQASLLAERGCHPMHAAGEPFDAAPGPSLVTASQPRPSVLRACAYRHSLILWGSNLLISKHLIVDDKANRIP
jgi:hypothetical protein